VAEGIRQVVAAEPSLADSRVLGPLRASIRTTRLLLYTPETARRLRLPLGGWPRIWTQNTVEPMRTGATGRDKWDG